MANMNLNKNQGEVRYLTPLDISTKDRKKYCRFKRSGIKYVDMGRQVFLKLDQ